MLARTALQRRVLVALIQCATMATEVVEVATESDLEDVVINCVAIFYEEGKEGENFRRAVRFNNRLLRELFTRQEGHMPRRNIYSAFHN